MAGAIFIIALVAWLTETILDVLKVHLTLGSLGNERFKATFWPCMAALVGIGLAFAFSASVVALISDYMAVNLAWPVDRILAGILAGAGGASAFYDFLDTTARPDVK